MKIADYETPTQDVCKKCAHYKEVLVCGEKGQHIDGRTKCGGCRQQAIVFKNYEEKVESTEGSDDK